MTINRQQVKKHLHEFEFSKLFTQELGWDNHNATLIITIDKKSFKLHAAAEKRGMAAFVLEGDIPEYATRLKIDRQVAKSAHEHLIIYADSGHTKQIWQWAKREPGRPVVYRETHYYNTQSGEALLQRVVLLSVTLKEEQEITTIDIANRARAAFDIDKVTKKFYDLFKNEHSDFLKFIKGIPDDGVQRWYASVMINRLMFVYFIQQKGFLDGNPNYLKDKLEVFSSKGKDKYYSDFLCPLFFSGFAKKEGERSAEANELLGKVPYLNGGIFQKHQIEKQHGRTIKIQNCAFMTLFEFFDQYKWHLDERPLKEKGEINPDVLGYIFEKYINQKQMGAYYTKEDITGYISKNTIIPFIFDAAKKKCKIAFEGEQSVWRELKQHPERYFYDAVKHGLVVNARVTPSEPLDKPFKLPSDISAGIADVPKRTNWNRLAPPEYGLPTEIWREVVARRQRYEEIHGKLTNGEVTDINDLITYNLDIMRFALDVIENSEGPELIRAIWGALDKITVLDPTCGSGAFLFAALNILKPLYEACLNRMQVFLDESDQSGDDQKHEKYNDFRKIIARIDDHPNREYFILKSIILNNLYGVDIMDEAIEICKLRLFLKLVAQIDMDESKENGGIEPLPDIDFNIRAGNTLVGYASLDEVQRSAEFDIIKKQSLPAITEKAEIASIAFEEFHKLQIEDEQSASNYVVVKKDLEEKLSELELELNKFLADEYTANASTKPKKLMAWVKSHRPFHWCIDFYRIISSGGFDVIIGNPPYVEYSKIRNAYKVLGFATELCNNLYALCSERAIGLLSKSGRFGIILPNSSISANKMATLQRLLVENKNTWISNYAWRPSKLFEGADMLLAIVLVQGCKVGQNIQATRYYKWHQDFRPYLFQQLSFIDVTDLIIVGSIPKIPDTISYRILEKLEIRSSGTTIRHSFSSQVTSHTLYYFRAVQYWIKILDRVPLYEEDGNQKVTGEMKPIYSPNKTAKHILVSVLSSNLYYLYYILWSSCQVINARDLNMPLNLNSLSEANVKSLASLGKSLQNDFWNKSDIKERQYSKKGRNFTMRKQHFHIKESKSIIDKIDRILADHIGFTDEELDFIINYDFKCRMGLASLSETEAI